MTPEQTRLVIELAASALSADYTKVRGAGNLLAKSLDAVDPAAAQQLRVLLKRKGVALHASGYTEQLPVDAKSRSPLIEQLPPPATPLFLNKAAQDVFQSFVEDAQNVEDLAAKGISANLSLLIYGPPGTGKTLFASHLANQLQRPLYTVRLDSVISSLLGDTAKNIRSVFDFVPSRDAVLLLDELDAVAKMRDDRHELGELKRVVNTVLQGLDSLDHRSIVVAATNHPDLLDRAIWRRFPYKLSLEYPDESVRDALWAHFLFAGRESEGKAALLARISEGMPGADIERIALAARRLAVATEAEVDIGSIAWNIGNHQGVFANASDRKGISLPEKRALASYLVRNKHVSQADVARLMGVTRQAISTYVRSEEHGE